MIQQLWTSLHSPDKPLVEYLSSFYDELLSMWHSEYSQASQVFPDPLGMLSCVFSEGVESLHPPLAQCLNITIQAATQPLKTLLQLREVCVYVCVSVCLSVFVGVVSQVLVIQLECFPLLHTQYG